MEIVLGAVIVGVVQVLKKTFAIPTRYVPITAVVVSLVLLTGAVIVDDTAVSWATIQNALIAGLSAVGLYETATKVVA